MDNVMTVQEIAEQCNISPQYVHLIIKEKNIPHMSYGKIKMKLLSRESVEKFFGKYMEVGNEKVCKD